MLLVLKNMKTGEYCSNSYGCTRRFEDAKIFVDKRLPKSDGDFKYVSHEDEMRNTI